jgi:hypothetical protein
MVDHRRCEKSQFLCKEVAFTYINLPTRHRPKTEKVELNRLGRSHRRVQALFFVVDMRRCVGFHYEDAPLSFDRLFQIAVCQSGIPHRSVQVSDKEIKI